MAQAEVQAAPVEMASAPQPEPVELAALGPAPVSDSVGFAAVEAAVNMIEPAPVAVAAVEEAPLIKASAGPAKAAAPSAPVKHGTNIASATAF